ncbi:MAG TPA: ATP-binding protein [Chitinophagaceae bacterium]|nr:ATP-binding protein [Chitinophagaceae bacterium]
MLKKIAVIGPESTGKSTLCERLAQHYRTQWCPEYARQYLMTYGMTYTYDDLLTIARGQLELEDKYIQSVVRSLQSSVQDAESREDSSLTPDSDRAHDSRLTTYDLRLTTQPPLLFIDTDMYVMKVWCEFVFGRCHQFILDQIAVRKYDLYFLCNVDLPWTPDPLREYPDFERRQRLYEIYKNIMIHQPIPWVEISGDPTERMQKAIFTINRLNTGQ